MHRMRVTRYLFTLFLFLFFSFLTLRQPLSSPTDYELMQEVIKNFVELTGDRIVGSGSWIKGSTFEPGVSDFDMRLLTRSGDPAIQIQKWKESQGKLVELIQKKFGSRANAILTRTNLYPPDQMMFGVEDQSEAAARFAEWRRMPNLKKGGKFTSANDIEGLWGEPGRLMRQKKELSEGLLFYKNPETFEAITSSPRSIHKAEGILRYNAELAAKSTAQCADIGLAYLSKGNSHELLKYLGRTDRELQRCRELSGAAIDWDFIKKLQKLQTDIELDPKLLKDPKFAAGAKQVLLRAKSESAILANYAKAGPMQKAYLRVMLDGVAAKNQLGDLIDTIGTHTPDWVNFTNAVKFMMIAAGTAQVAEAAGHGDTDEAVRSTLILLKSASVKGLSLSSLVASIPGYSALLLAQMIVEIRMEAKQAGVLLAVGRQNPWELISGIYRAWGAGYDPDPRYGKERTLGDLVARFHSESRLEAWVLHMCGRAVSQGARPPEWGPRVRATVEDTKKAIFDRCWPIIRFAWLWEREMLMAEYLNIRSELVHTPLFIGYTPQKPKLNESVIASVHNMGQHLEQSLFRMEVILKLLYGSKSFLGWQYFWDPEGSHVSLKNRRSFIFQTLGNHQVDVRLSLKPYPGGNDPAGFRSENVTETRIMREYELEASVYVEIVGETGDQVQVPDVVGLPQATAEKAIKDVGLEPSSTTETLDTAPTGQVVKQNPLGGTKVQSGSTVNIAVSSGAKGLPVSGVFKPHRMEPTMPGHPAYFQDFQIEYTVKGLYARQVTDTIGQTTGRRSYSGCCIDGDPGELRVSGTASGSNLGNSSQYAGRIVVKVRLCSSPEEVVTYPIAINTSPPYAFDVSVPVPSGCTRVSFSITTGMAWPNGFFNISVSGG